MVEAGDQQDQEIVFNVRYVTNNELQLAIEEVMLKVVGLQEKAKYHPTDNTVSEQLAEAQEVEDLTKLNLIWRLLNRAANVASDVNIL